MDDNGTNGFTPNGNKMIVLIEDLPNFVIHDPKKLHTILRQYLATGRNPIVFIMSDSNTDASVHSIFPKNIQLELRMRVINFNAVTATNLSKCMMRIVNEESKTNDIDVPTKETYDSIASSCNGDIRSCINSLQFACTKIIVSLPQKTVAKNKNVENSKSKEKTKKPVKNAKKG